MLQGSSFGSRMGEKLAGGLEKGVDRGLEFANAMKLQQAKTKTEDIGLKERGRESIKNMREIVSKGNTGWNVWNVATEEGRGDRAALDTAALNLERLAVEMQGKGTLNQARFDYMVKRLPSSQKTDAQNNRILDEWEKILDEEEGGSSKKTTSSKSKKTKLTDDIVYQLLDDAKGDMKKARKLAADRGYTW